MKNTIIIFYTGKRIQCFRIPSIRKYHFLELFVYKWSVCKHNNSCLHEFGVLWPRSSVFGILLKNKKSVLLLIFGQFQETRSGSLPEKIF